MFLIEHSLIYVLFLKKGICNVLLYKALVPLALQRRMLHPNVTTMAINNEEPSYARLQYWSQMKDVSLCFERNTMCRKSKQIAFLPGPVEPPSGEGSPLEVKALVLLPLKPMASLADVMLDRRKMESKKQRAIRSWLNALCSSGRR